MAEAVEGTPGELSMGAMRNSFGADACGRNHVGVDAGPDS
jgi:hypothetical protein